MQRTHSTARMQRTHIAMRVQRTHIAMRVQRTHCHACTAHTLPCVYSVHALCIELYAERMRRAPRRERTLMRRMPAKPKLTVATHAAAVTIAVTIAAVTIATAATNAAGTRRALRVVGDTPARDAGAAHQLRQELRLRPRLEDHRSRRGALSAHE